MATKMREEMFSINHEMAFCREFAIIMLVFVGAISVCSQEYSGTLPILVINTDGGKNIESKKEYIGANYYLDNLGDDEVEPIGSVSSTLKMEIRGRGNSTWERYDKKPYKIKLETKTPLLGMNKSKHFALLPQAEDTLAFLKNPVAFEVSKRIGMPWTPETKPVELFLNGDYRGLYFLTENIRIEKTRVDIEEQANGETDDDIITGGWLLEIDQYEDSPQIVIQEGNWNMMRVTSHSPDSLSNEQLMYLTSLIENCNRTIYMSDKNNRDWENFIDLESLVRFYIVGEIMDNVEQFHGSCWIYKDRGGGKLYFGPVWDFGICFEVKNEKFIYEESPYGMSWISEIAKFPRFQDKVSEIWADFYKKGNTNLDGFIDAFVSKISIAAKCNFDRWPQYGNSNIPLLVRLFKDRLNSKVAFLNSVWNDASDLSSISDVNSEILSITKECDILRISGTDVPLVECVITDLRGFRIFPIRRSSNEFVFRGVFDNTVYILNVLLSDKRNIKYKFML